MKNPDMMINSDMRILQQILGMALQKQNGVSIPVFTINQVVINVSVAADNRRALIGTGDPPRLTAGKDPERSERAKRVWEKRRLEEGK